MRDKILAIVARYQGVSTEAISDETLLGEKALAILAQVAAELQINTVISDLTTATVGDLVKLCDG